MLEFLTALAKVLSSIFGLAEKAIPSDAIREDKHQIRKPRLEQKEKIRIYDREFRRLKDHPEIPIALDLSFVNDNLDEDDRKELEELLVKRITEYRLKHPIIFRKWLKQNKLNKNGTN